MSCAHALYKLTEYVTMSALLIIFGTFNVTLVNAELHFNEVRYGGAAIPSPPLPQWSLGVLQSKTWHQKALATFLPAFLNP